MSKKRCARHKILTTVWQRKLYPWGKKGGAGAVKKNKAHTRTYMQSEEGMAVVGER